MGKEVTAPGFGKAVILPVASPAGAEGDPATAALRAGGAGV